MKSLFQNELNEHARDICQDVAQMQYEVCTLSVRTSAPCIMLPGCEPVHLCASVPADGHPCGRVGEQGKRDGRGRAREGAGGAEAACTSDTNVHAARLANSRRFQ